MNCHFNTTDLDDFYQKLNEIGFLHKNTTHVHEFEVLQKFGSGYMRHYSYQNGLHISLGNMKLHEDFVYSFDIDHKYFELVYIHAGYLEIFDTTTQQQSQVNTNESILFVNKKYKGWVIHPKDNNIHFLSITIDEEYIVALAAKGIDIREKMHLLQKILVSHSPHKLTITIENLVNKIFLCPYEDENIKKMFFEAVILEILAEYFFQSVIEEKIPKSPVILTHGDIERLYLAKRIVLEKMTTPPSIEELSKIICLNTCKLKIGFKTLFSCTIYGYLRRARMEKARLLLKDTQLSIHDIALQLGYCKGSSLSPIFKEYYGVTPKQYRQN